MVLNSQVVDPEGMFTGHQGQQVAKEKWSTYVSTRLPLLDRSTRLGSLSVNLQIV